MSIEDFPTRHPYALGLLQHYTEKTLAAWIGELGVPIYYNAEAVGLGQDDAGVDVALADGSTLRVSTSSGVTAGAAPSARRPGLAFRGMTRPARRCWSMPKSPNNRWSSVCYASPGRRSSASCRSKKAGAGSPSAPAWTGSVSNRRWKRPKKR